MYLGLSSNRPSLSARHQSPWKRILVRGGWSAKSSSLKNIGFTVLILIFKLGGLEGVMRPSCFFYAKQVIVKSFYHGLQFRYPVILLFESVRKFSLLLNLACG